MLRALRIEYLGAIYQWPTVCNRPKTKVNRTTNMNSALCKYSGLTPFLARTLSDGDRTYWANFHGGDQRIKKTESMTKDLLGDFQSYVRANGKPCGECWKAFLGGK